jgi:hypothetical protein
MRLASTALRPGIPAGARVGALSVSIGPERDLVPLRVARSLVDPSLRWRLVGR